MDVAALVQGPQMEMDGVSSELKTNGFVVLNPAFDYRIQQEVVPKNVVQLTTHLQVAVDEAWPNRFGSRYKRVKVLLASWDADDLGVIKEVRALEHVFIDFYRFDVSTYIIPSHHPDRALTRQAIEFVDSALKDTLLIFYYAGHASMNPNRYESIIWSANRQRNSPALTLNGIQALFEAADCDALLLYDCCHSANTAITPAKSSRGATELIAACGFEGIAAEVGKHSFTNALIEVLALSSSGSSFSASQLHIRIVQQLKKWNPSPTRDESRKFVRDSFGRPVMEPQRRRTPVYCNLTPDGGRKTIMLPCIPQGPIAENFTPPLGGSSTSFTQIVSMAALSPPVIMGTNAISSNEAVARNPHMIITVKMVDEVVAGQQDPNFDAWLEWLRSAPPDADRIGIAEAAPIPIDPDFGDDADSAAGDEIAESTASLTDSILDYRKIHGRTFQNSKTTEYWGPNDDQQNDGLDITHHYLTLLLDDQLFLAPLGDHPQNVLDVGTGTGIWAIDFADQFPSAEVIGTDISPIQPAWVPPNCKFEIDDTQMPWTWPVDHFDFVHIRNLHGSISDWPALYAHCFRHTKPGGLIEELEFDIATKSDKVGPDHVYVQWNNLFAEYGEKMGKTFKVATQMKQQIIDAGFVDVAEKKWKVPIGGWSSDSKLRRVGLYTLLFLEQSLEGFALYMLKEIMGWEYVEIQVLVAKMRQALRDWRLYPYCEITLVYGRKPEGS